MLINQTHRAVVLVVKNPARLLTLLPRAKAFEYQGRQLVAVPHGVDETKVLNNLKLKVPSPIRFYYDWPGKYQPFQAQRVTAEFLTLNPRAFVLNDLGTGKTLSMLWAAEFLKRSRQVQRVLIVSPLSTLRRVWEDEIRGSFIQRKLAVLHGSAAKRRKLLAEPHDYYIVNHDGLRVIEDELMTRQDIDLIIVDEAASYRNATTDRWETLDTVINGRLDKKTGKVTGVRRARAWLATATPTPNAPTDAWAQVKLLFPAAVAKHFTRFRDATMVQRSAYKWEPKPDALDVVQRAMQPSLRFTRDECVDIPPAVYISKEAQLTPEQTKAYREMLKAYHTECDAGGITAANEGVKRGKLVQILCGAVYPDEGGVQHLPCKPRLDVVAECIEEAPSKVIVFAPLIAVVEMLYAHLRKRWDVAKVYGDTPTKERDAIFAAFQQTDQYRVLVAHPQTMAHGLTLTRAAVIVWYAPTSPEFYTQANGRITRPGQKLQQTIIHIEATALEREMYHRLKEKVSMQGALLDMLKESGKKDIID